MPFDCCDFSNKEKINQNFLNKVISFAGQVKESFSQILKIITPQEPVNTLVADEEIIEPKYFEEGQNGYIPSTEGYVDEQATSTYIPSTTPAPKVEQDTTKAQTAIRNSYLTEKLVNKKISGGINPHLGKWS